MWRDFARSRDQRVMWFYWWEHLLASRHPAKFGGHRHCCNGDILFLVDEVQNSRCFHFNRHFCLFLYRLKHMTYHIINSGPDHTHWKQQLDENLKWLLLVRPKSPRRKRKRLKRKTIANRFALHANTTKVSNCKAFCIPHKRKKKKMC